MQLCFSCFSHTDRVEVWVKKSHHRCCRQQHSVHVSGRLHTPSNILTWQPQIPSDNIGCKNTCGLPRPHQQYWSLIMPVVTAGRVLSLILIPFNAHVYFVMSGVLFCSIERCETHSVRVLLIRCVMILMASQASGSTAWLLWLGIPKCRTRAFGIRNQQELIWIFWWIFTCLSIFIMATDAHTAHMHYTLCV